MSSIPCFDRLCQLIGELVILLNGHPDESTLLAQAHLLLTELVHQDDWLPEDCARPGPQRCQQYLLHVDSRQRSSVVSFVWGPGQITPVHDHRVWDLIGMFYRAEYSQPYASGAGGRLHPSEAHRYLRSGEVEVLSPRTGDMYQMSNAFSNCTSISIHVHGANIGAVRHAVFSAEGEEKPLVSGYSNSRLPNIWDLSKENLV